MSTGQVWLTNTLGVTMWSPALSRALKRGGPAAGEVSAVRRCEGCGGRGQGPGAGVPLERSFRRGRAGPLLDTATMPRLKHPQHECHGHHRVPQLRTLNCDAGRPTAASGSWRYMSCRKLIEPSDS